ncbi:hypothetical protein AV530_001928 [Patagioenas fasciata monilis]|uniref:Uncharacterized protein n=1 Tax=Patagioenas fasciata monilis TaxID=372326 RepID=A0A1V4J6B1_PATFA|nr:hypothetical protein AV530_001928 [Patagioenas fasciata monilis]
MPRVRGRCPGLPEPGRAGGDGAGSHRGAWRRGCSWHGGGRRDAAVRNQDGSIRKGSLPRINDGAPQIRVPR